MVIRGKIVRQGAPKILVPLPPELRERLEAVVAGPTSSAIVALIEDGVTRLENSTSEKVIEVDVTYIK